MLLAHPAKKTNNLTTVFPHSGEQEKESIIRVRIGQKNHSLGITVGHHSAILVMPNGDP